MTAAKVGIREFRAGLSDFVDSDVPVAVTGTGTRSDTSSRSRGTAPLTWPL